MFTLSMYAVECFNSSKEWIDFVLRFSQICFRTNSYADCKQQHAPSRSHRIGSSWIHLFPEAPAGWKSAPDKSSLWLLRQGHGHILHRAFCTVSACVLFLSLQTFSGSLNLRFSAKQLSHSRCCSCRAPSCIFRFAGRTIEVNGMRVCSRLCPATRFSCLLRLPTLEKDEFAGKIAPSQVLLFSQVSQLHI